MPDYARMIEASREAVTLASVVCRQVQASLEQVRAITKDDKSPVTVADFASQAIVAYVLRERLGEIVLVGEEASQFLREADHAAHLDATLTAVREVWTDASVDDVLAAIDVGAGDTSHRSFWTLDPIDGTKGFLRNQQYAIALGYIESGVPTIGVMGCPNLPMDLSEPLDEADATGCLYYGIRGEGVYEAPCDDALAKPIRITRLDHARGQPILVCASVEKAHTNVDDTDRILAHIGEESDMVRLDSQAKYAVVARGQADAYIRMPTRKGYVERIWDHAAGAMIAAEAGAAVTDIDGRELDFSHGRGLEKNRGIVCAPPRVHGLIIGAIRALGLGSAE
ncbi:MAG: 3'(2'),5'-bisphosphate nucleotidase [Phycisphaeraceae bacterium]|nr:3'(2'),5'-bisphosphate nucleotidase [Phycisphaeraceae bacterium]MCW5764248.1 3'(2'),5'-bisphosphate nucleotidase [Phycisphaeraceae bacterium]